MEVAMREESPLMDQHQHQHQHYDMGLNDTESFDGEHTKIAYAIALDKLRKQLQYGYANADREARLNNRNYFIKSLHLLHNEIFTAAGYVPWLQRNLPDDGTIDIVSFKGEDYTGEDILNHKLKDILLREVIWLLAEQIRHCPQRMNWLFHHFRKQNGSWYDKDKNRLLYHFMRLKKTDDVLPLLAMSAPPVLDRSTILKGINKFKKGKLNFDDIDDCGKWNEPKLQKTFYEVPGGSLFFLILKYASGMIQFKLWSVLLVFFFYEFGTPFPDLSLTIVDSLFAVRGAVLLDFGVLLILQINDWALRLYCVRYKPFHFIPLWTKIKLGLQFLQILSVIVYMLVFVLAFKYTFISAVDKGLLYYLGMRLIINLCTEFFPFTPTIPIKRNSKAKLSKANEICWNWKGLKSRLLARSIFFLILTVASMIYEYFFVVPSISSLFKDTYCGNQEWKLTLPFNGYFSLDVQDYICMASTVLLWLSTVLAMAIDNGLAFITVMALVGWIRGYRSQGGSRSRVQITRLDLLKELLKRFYINTKPFDVSPESPSSSILLDSLILDSKQVQQDGYNLSKGKNLWDWCVSTWRSLDLISDKESEYLSAQENLHISYLSAPDAQKHISFFIKTLSVNPQCNYKFADIMPTTILIPVYKEKLEFDWKPTALYSPQNEFAHLVAKYPDEWLNFIERLEREDGLFGRDKWAQLEKHIIQQEVPPDTIQWLKITEWLSSHDQYVYKTVKGACAYYDALIELAKIEGYSTEEATKLARGKVQVILCVQLYSSEKYNEYSPILHKWLREFPCLQVVIDFERKPNMHPEFSVIPDHIDYATCLLEWNHKQSRVIYKYILPRTNPLLISDPDGRKIQGKSMNQVNGLTFAFGRFIQVLDSNQGAHATEYLKFPSLLRHFRLHPQTGDVRHRIIGSREYIFTKNLGTVARCHAYQEWSFGTLVLRTYSDLGIRLHYGHPDVFHGPWTSAHAGLSKVNPDINTSEDVFAGFETMKCKQSSKHLEHIEFLKGRETGLANMSFFDTKISQGNSGILRSRDLYYLMENLDYVTSFLLFQGVSGHFTTISLMMWSMKVYILTLFLITLSGASLKAFGNLTYSTEWLFHAGLITVIPLFVEFLVEYGPVIGILRSLAFLPISTMIYLFQMQTKHNAFIQGIFTGKSAHINTGRGLSIYRSTLDELFRNYGNTHIIPMIDVMALAIAYYTMSSDLGGGTLPLIMIQVLCFSVILSPQVFNPSFYGNNLRELSTDLMNFMIWIGSGDNLYVDQWTSLKQLAEENSFLTHWISIDYNNLPVTPLTTLRSILYHTLLLSFWVFVSAFLQYAHIQLWECVYLSLWALNIVVYFLILYVFRSYEQPLRIIFIYLGLMVGMGYLLIHLGRYGILDFASMYVAFLTTIKVLESLRALVLDFVVAISFIKFPVSSSLNISAQAPPPLPQDPPATNNTTPQQNPPPSNSLLHPHPDPSQKPHEDPQPTNIPSDSVFAELDESKEVTRQQYLCFMINIINQLFLVMTGRILVALVWGTLSGLVGLLMRPLFANFFLFGSQTGHEHNFTFLKHTRTRRAKQDLFGIKLNV